MSKRSVSKKDNSGHKIAFVRAGVEGEDVFHVESESNDPERSLVQLINASLRWAKRPPGDDERLSLRCGRPPASPEASSRKTPFQALNFLGFLANTASSSQVPDAATHAGSGASDANLIKCFSKEEFEHYALLAPDAKQSVVESLHNLRSTVSFTTPLRFRVLHSELPQDLKRSIFRKLERQQEATSSGDMVKYTTWVEALLSVPLKKYLWPRELSEAGAVKDVLQHALGYLDSVVYGHPSAKQAMLERLFLWLKHPMLPQRPLALKGCPGNGKTSLVREGLSVIMKLPFNLVALGGSFDSSFLLGHSYTYEGSTPGRIAEALASSGCMNPIIFFDEVDKCSATQKGEEVINVLIHITDPVQNSHFRDRYLHGLELDLSKATMIFAFNDASKVNPVLLDRFQVVETDTFDAASQAKILEGYLLPSIVAERSLPKDFFTLSADCVREVTKNCSKGGVRGVRSLLEQAVCKTCIFHETQDASLLFPLKPGDLLEISTGGYQLVGGVRRLLEAARGESQGPPLGMYA
jgi:hypothetical protein